MSPAAEARLTRVARLRAAHSYGLVLGLIIVVFVFTSVAPNSAWADSTLVLLQSLTLVTALWTSGVAQADSKISIGLVGLATASALALLVFGGDFFKAVVLVLAGLLTIATIATVALGIVDQGEANVKAVTGAVCVYILIGLLFVFLYGLIAVVSWATSSPREPTALARCASTSASSRWRRWATATTRRPTRSAGRLRSSRRCSASCTS